LFGWGKKKDEEDKPKTLGELAAKNSSSGWKSASGGSAGFANKKTGYVEVKGKYLDEGFVDEDADVMAKLGKLFGGGKKK